MDRQSPQMLSQTDDNIRKELLKLKKLMECPICLQLMTDPMITRCVHRFCSDCIRKSIESSTHEFCRCPLCQEKITKRALRPQTDVSHLIQGFKEVVERFEGDIGKKIITNADDVVIFDVSTDKSKSYLQINDSIGTTVDHKSNGSPLESTVEGSDDKTELIDDWPSCETMREEVEELSKNCMETTKKSINGKTDKCAESEAQVNRNAIPSQNLTVNKSKITYSSSRNSIGDRFDLVINASNYNINADDEHKQTIKRDKEVKAKPKVRREYVSSDSDSEVECIDKVVNTYQRKPLMPLKDTNNKDLKAKNKFKRVQTIDSSDDDFSSPVLKSKKRVPVMRESDDFENDMSDEDLLPSIHHIK